MAKFTTAGVWGLLLVAGVSIAANESTDEQSHTVKVFTPPWEGVFRVDRTDLLRVEARAFDWQQVEIHVAGPAVVQRTVEIIPDKEHSRFAVAKSHSGDAPNARLVEGTHREYEIRPTGPGRVTVKIDRTIKREFNGRRIPEGPHEVTEYAFIVE